MISSSDELAPLLELARAGARVSELVVVRGGEPTVPYVRVRTAVEEVGAAAWLARVRSSCETHAQCATLAVRSVSHDGGEAAVVFDRVPGVSLAMLTASAAVDESRLPAPVAAALVAELARTVASLHHAHPEAMHGRIHPANVVLGPDGRVHLGPPHVDVMVSSACARGSALPYLAPEQLAEDEPSREGDVFALAVIFVELLTGHAVRDAERAPHHLRDLWQAALSTEFPSRPSAGALADALFGLERVTPRALDAHMAELVTARFGGFLEERTRAFRDALQAERRMGPQERRLLRASGDPATSRLVGRAETLLDLESRLDGGARLISVVGPAGVGKTRVAAALASSRQHAEGRDPDATAALRWCDVSGLDSEIALDDAIEEWTRAAVAGGASGTLIFVLDGADRLVMHGAARLARWVRDRDDVQLLVTTRARLGVEGEHIVELAPLPTDGWDTPGVRLLRAAAGDRATRFDGAEREALTHLAGRLEGIPLALELAGRRLSLLRPSQLLAELEARGAEALDALASGSEPGSRSLREAIELSLSLLSDEALDVLRACTTFGRTFDAIDAVAVGGRALGPTLDALTELRERSLLWSPSPKRLRLYDAVRELVDDGLAPDTRRRLRARHASHLAARAEAATRAVDAGERVLDHLVRVARDREDFLAALEVLADDDLEGASHVTRVLGYSTYRGARQRQLIAALHERISAAPGASTAARARVALAHVGHPWDRRPDAPTVLAALTARPDALPAAWQLEMAWCLADSRTPGEANEGLEARVRGWLSEPDLAPVHRVYGFRALARIARARGDLDAALDAMRAAIDTARRSSLVGLRAAIAAVAAGVALDVDGPREARELADEALDLAEGLGSVPIRFTALCARAAAMQEQGDPDAAHREFVDAAALAERIERRSWQTAAAAHAAMASIEAGRPEAALRELEAIRRVATTPRDHIFGVVTMFAAAAARRAGNEARAVEHLAAARVDIGEVDAHRSVIEVLAPWIEPEGDSADAAIGRARAAFAGAPTRLFEHRAALRLVESALDEERAASRPLEIVAEGRWVRTPAGDTIDFRRRKLVRTLLMALVKARAQGAPEVAIDGMIEAGWPGTRLRAEVMRNRLHVAMNRLRGLGLREYLETTPEGWRLHPEVPIVRAAS